MEEQWSGGVLGGTQIPPNSILTGSLWTQVHWVHSFIQQLFTGPFQIWDTKYIMAGKIIPSCSLSQEEDTEAGDINFKGVSTPTGVFMITHDKCYEQGKGRPTLECLGSRQIPMRKSQRRMSRKKQHKSDGRGVQAGGGSMPGFTQVGRTGWTRGTEGRPSGWRRGSTEARGVETN